MYSTYRSGTGSTTAGGGYLSRNSNTAPTNPYGSLYGASSGGDDPYANISIDPNPGTYAFPFDEGKEEKKDEKTKKPARIQMDSDSESSFENFEAYMKNIRGQVKTSESTEKSPDFNDVLGKISTWANTTTIPAATAQPTERISFEEETEQHSVLGKVSNWSDFIAGDSILSFGAAAAGAPKNITTAPMSKKPTLGSSAAKTDLLVGKNTGIAPVAAAVEVRSVSSATQPTTFSSFAAVAARKRDLSIEEDILSDISEDLDHSRAERKSARNVAGKRMHMSPGFDSRSQSYIDDFEAFSDEDHHNDHHQHSHANTEKQAHVHDEPIESKDASSSQFLQVPKTASGAGKNGNLTLGSGRPVSPSEASRISSSREKLLTVHERVDDANSSDGDFVIGIDGRKRKVTPELDKSHESVIAHLQMQHNEPRSPKNIKLEPLDDKLSPTGSRRSEADQAVSRTNSSKSEAQKDYLKKSLAAAAREGTGSKSSTAPDEPLVAKPKQSSPKTEQFVNLSRKRSLEAPRNEKSSPQETRSSKNTKSSRTDERSKSPKSEGRGRKERSDSRKTKTKRHSSSEESEDRKVSKGDSRKRKDSSSSDSSRAPSVRYRKGSRGSRKDKRRRRRSRRRRRKSYSSSSSSSSSEEESAPRYHRRRRREKRTVRDIATQTEVGGANTGSVLWNRWSSPMDPFWSSGVYGAMGPASAAAMAPYGGFNTALYCKNGIGAVPMGYGRSPYIFGPPPRDEDIQASLERCEVFKNALLNAKGVRKVDAGEGAPGIGIDDVEMKNRSASPRGDKENMSSALESGDSNQQPASLTSAIDLVDQSFRDQLQLLRTQTTMQKAKLANLANRKPTFTYTSSNDLKRILEDRRAEFHMMRR